MCAVRRRTHVKDTYIYVKMHLCMKRHMSKEMSCQKRSFHIYMHLFIYMRVFDMCAVRTSLEMSRETCIYAKTHVKTDVYSCCEGLNNSV